MAGRTSARSSVQRDIASSPPKLKSSPRQAEKHVEKKIIITRSQSVDLETRGKAMNLRNGRTTRSRQGSADAETLNKFGTITRPTTATPGPSPLEGIEELASEDDTVEDNELPSNIRSSPSVADTDGNLTTYTQGFLDDLSHRTPKELTDALPELYAYARKIIKGARAPNIQFTNSVNGLQNHSGLFKRDQDERDEFIVVHVILQKLFGTEYEQSDTDSLNDILRTANLAILASQIVHKKQQQNRNPLHLDDLLDLFQKLDKEFSTLFVPDVNANIALAQEAFYICLDIRTQRSIYSFKQQETDYNFDPDVILTSVFFGPKGLRDFEGIEGINLDLTSLENQKHQINERIRLIRKHFKEPDNATGPGEYLYLDALQEEFPLEVFYDEVINYSKQCLAEVDKKLATHGGIDDVVKSIEDAIPDLEPEDPIQVNFEQETVMEDSDQSGSALGAKKHHPLKRSFYKENSKSAILKLAELSSMKTLLNQRRPEERPSSAPHTSHAVDQVPEAQSNSIIPAGLANFSSKKKVKVPKNGTKNVSKLKGPFMSRMLDPDTRGEQVLWESQYDTPEKQGMPKANKRKTTRQQPPPKSKKRKASSPETASDDEGFEQDTRTHDERRNKRQKTWLAAAKLFQSGHRASYGSATLVEPNGAGSETENELAEQAAHEQRSKSKQVSRQRSQRSQARDLRSRQVSVRPNSIRAPFEGIGNDSDDERPPQSSISERRETAAVKRAAKSSDNRTQTRRPWSLEDEEHLQRLIEELGTSWARIEARGGFRRDVDQGALKDKAKHLKVEIICASEDPESLPRNFENIALSASHIRKIRKVIPDWVEDWK